MSNPAPIGEIITRFITELQCEHLGVAASGDHMVWDHRYHRLLLLPETPEIDHPRAMQINGYILLKPYTNEH